ncbi:MAG TPA: hypothetical protein V6D08_15400 [Candidatus Obscuribacterales bacterium]
MSTQSITTGSKSFLPKGRIKISLPFRVPREHGALVCFAISTVLAIKLAWQSLDFLLLPGIALWLTFLLSHRPVRAFWFAVLSAFLIALASGAYTLAVPVALFGIGIRITSTVAASFGSVWRELMGMIGVAAMPLIMASIASRADAAAWTATLAYTASAVAASAMIHILRRDSKRIEPYLWFSGALWIWLGVHEPGALLWCAMPFFPQLLFLSGKAKPSFKLLGILESAAMLWVSIFLWVSVIS